jgi:hypothetical protein
MEPGAATDSPSLELVGAKDQEIAAAIAYVAPALG